MGSEAEVEPRGYKFRFWLPSVIKVRRSATVNEKVMKEQVQIRTDAAYFNVRVIQPFVMFVKAATFGIPKKESE